MAARHSRRRGLHRHGTTRPSSHHPRSPRPRRTIGSRVSARALAAGGCGHCLAALPVIYAIKDLDGHGDLSRLGQNLLEGVSNGSIWALIAIGYTLVYGIIELINFAHGDVFMIGSFVVGRALRHDRPDAHDGAARPRRRPAASILVIAMVACGSLNVMIEKVGYRPLRSAPKLAPLITAVGFSFILQNVGLLWLGGSPASVPDLIHAQQDVFTIFGITVQRADLLAIGVTVPLVIATDRCSSAAAGSARRCARPRRIPTRRG